MVVTCSVKGCSAAWKPGIKYHRIPSENNDPELRRQWLRVMGIRVEDVKPHHRVCSRHFLSGEASKDKLHPDHVPSQQLHDHSTKSSLTITSRQTTHQDLERYMRASQRSNRETQAKCIEAAQTDKENLSPETNKCRDTGSQTVTFVRYLREIGTQTDDTFTQLLLENDHLKTQVSYLQNELQKAASQVQENAQSKSLLSELTKKHQEISKVNADLRVKIDELNAKIGDQQSDIVNLQRHMSALRQRVEDLKDSEFGFEFLKNNDNKTQFYTGLPDFPTLNAFITYIIEKEKDTPGYTVTTTLQKANEIVMVLVKLRLNLLNQDMAYRFKISMYSVSKKFHDWLNLIYISLGGMVVWPTSDLEMQLPPVFQNRFLKRTKVVIDCFEVFIDRPLALKARAQTYSNYKSHNTAKALIGISPSGCITFHSSFWGGKASDKEITLDSGLLEKLLPGEAILADRGFLIIDECTKRGILLLRPAFTRGKAQLSRKNVELSRLYSRARIHVERVISKLRDYRILKGPIPISLVRNPTAMDKILRVCCVLTNMCGPVLRS